MLLGKGPPFPDSIRSARNCVGVIISVAADLSACPTGDAHDGSAKFGKRGSDLLRSVESVFLAKR